uniref:DUF1618 domain-containing protein n=2 Tax=Zea mays TaxID=4577 RepID=A0A804PHP6_MAIZE
MRQQPRSRILIKRFKLTQPTRVPRTSPHQCSASPPAMSWSGPELAKWSRDGQEAEQEPESVPRRKSWSAPELAQWSRAGKEKEQEEPESSEPQRKWVALVSVVVLPSNEDERAHEIIPGTDMLMLDLNDPPLPSYLVLHPRVAPNPRRTNEPLSAYILAADRSGCILLQVVEGNRPDFFLCNTHTRTVTILPPVSSYTQANDVGLIYLHLSMGLIADPQHSGHYMVAQLHPTTSYSQPNKLLYYSTAKCRWFARNLSRARQQVRMRNPNSEIGVLAHDGRLWWFSPAYGVFCCDPFTPVPESPALRFIPLPAGSEMAGHVAFDRVIKPLVRKRRCVRPSEGKLRFVEIRGLSYKVPVDESNPTVWMWTLVDPEVPNPWTFEYEVAFAEIWEDETYAAAGLQPGEVPDVALVDPNDHYVVYFFQGSKLFGLDLREKKVVGCEEWLIDRDRLEYQSSRPIVDAWELSPPPPSPPILSGDDDYSTDGDRGVWCT